MSRPKEEHFLILNLVVEKGASKDRDQSGSSITRPRTGTPTRFVQRSRLDFGLRTSPYTVDIYFFFIYHILESQKLPSNFWRKSFMSIE